MSLRLNPDGKFPHDPWCLYIHERSKTIWLAQECTKYRQDAWCGCKVVEWQPSKVPQAVQEILAVLDIAGSTSAGVKTLNDPTGGTGTLSYHIYELMPETMETLLNKLPSVKRKYKSLMLSYPVPTAN
jgi:hypothetical protein